MYRNILLFGLTLALWIFIACCVQVVAINEQFWFSFRVQKVCISVCPWCAGRTWNMSWCWTLPCWFWLTGDQNIIPLQLISAMEHADYHNWDTFDQRNISPNSVLLCTFSWRPLGLQLLGINLCCNMTKYNWNFRVYIACSNFSWN